MNKFNHKIFFVEIRAINEFKKKKSISNHFFNKNESHRNNIINFSIIINSRKMKNAHINYDNDKDFELRHNNENLNRFQIILCSGIQVDTDIKYISHRNDLYKIKNRI